MDKMITPLEKQLAAFSLPFYSVIIVVQMLKTPCHECSVKISNCVPRPMHA